MVAKKVKIGNVPNLRFPGFTYEWDVKKLGEVTLSISSGKSKNRNSGRLYPFYGSTGIIAYSDEFEYSGDKILIARVGANAGSLYRVNGEYSVSDNTVYNGDTGPVKTDDSGPVITVINGPLFNTIIRV